MITMVPVTDSAGATDERQRLDMEAHALEDAYDLKAVGPPEPARSTSKNPKLPGKKNAGVTRPRRQVTIACKRKIEDRLLRVSPS